LILIKINIWTNK